MAENASINKVIQFGLETVAGTAVAAPKLMTALSVELGPEIEVSRYRPSGGKFETTASLDREWIGADLSGPITYTEIIYPLASVLVKPTPTGAGTAKTWVFKPLHTAADTIATYTVERGGAVSAVEFSYGLVTELSLEFSTSGNELSGAMIGKAMTTGITMTAGPTSIALIPVEMKHLSVKLADTAATLTAAPKLGRVVGASWSIANRFGPVWVLNESTSWAAHVELPIELECTLRMQADAEGIALLTTMRAGSTKFMRIDAIHTLMAEAAIPYSIQIDTAGKVVGVSRFEDEDGQDVIEWTMGGFYDPTFAGATSVTVVNTLTAL